MRFWHPRGTIGSPVSSYGLQSLFRAYHSVGSISCFSHSFLLLALIHLKVPGWLPSSGRVEVCPSRSCRWVVPSFAPFSHLGGIPFCRLESRLLPFSFSYFSILVPRDASCLCHERSLVFCWVFWRLWLLLCFLFSFLVLFFRIVLIFFWLCAWKDPRLLMVAENPGYLISCHGFLFLFDVSLFGLQASWAYFFILWWSPCTCFFGLGLFSFGLGSLFWASLTVILLDLTKMITYLWNFSFSFFTIHNIWSFWINTSHFELDAWNFGYFNLMNKPMAFGHHTFSIQVAFPFS